MQFLLQILIILLFSGLGEVLQALIPLPIPAAIYGIVLLLIALCTGLVKPERIEKAAHFLISVMPLLFVSPAVNILQHWGLIQGDLAAIITIVAVSTVLVFAVAGLVTQLLTGKEGEKDG